MKTGVSGFRSYAFQVQRQPFRLSVRKGQSKAQGLTAQQFLAEPNLPVSHTAE